MKNINKEFYSGEKKEKAKEELNEEGVEKEEIISRRDFMKKTLSGAGVLLAAPFVGKIEAALGQSGKKEISDLERGMFKEQDPEKIIDRLNYIIEKIGPFAYKQLGCLPADIYDLNNRPEAKRKLIENLNQKPEVKKDIKKPVAMDSLKQIGLEPKLVQEFLKTLPESWRKEVALITYLDKPTEVMANEITGEKDKLVAHHQSKGKEAQSEIYFFPGAKEKRPVEDLFPFLIYECAHANNWRNRADLSFGQRISLLYEVIKRVESSDRFKYEMIEKISYKEKKREIAKKAIEYWAAISLYSIMCVEHTKKNPHTQPPVTDIKLVHDYLKMTDPDFDILKMAKKRIGFLKRVQAEREAVKSS